MLKSKLFFAMVVLPAAAGAQPKAPTPFCSAINKLIVGAQATPVWAKVARGKKGLVIPAGFKTCDTTSYSSSNDYNCSADATSATVKATYQKLVADLQSCLAMAPKTRVDGVATHSVFKLSGKPVEVTLTKVEAPARKDFGFGLTVRNAF